MVRRVLLLAAVVSLLAAADARMNGAPAPPAKEKKEDKEALALPEGVIHVSLPPGTIKWVRVFNKKGEPLLRVSVGDTVIEARQVFIGDGKAATLYEATKEGIHWPSVPGRKGMVLQDGTMTWVSGTTEAKHFLTVDKLKPGSLYLTTPDPNHQFEFIEKKDKLKP